MPRPHGLDEPRGVGIAVLTVSDSRTERDDESGDLARRLIEAAGHRVIERRVVPDEIEAIRQCLAGWLERRECRVILINGGTGVAPRDRTCEAVSGLLDRRLEGFGELFRALSFTQVGALAMLSGALGGLACGKPLFALPGSPRAVELGLTRLVLPALGHILAELARRDEPERSS
jgi:molybdenum cofactor biosynthesis protein B